MLHASCICIFTSIKYTNCAITVSITYAEAVTQRSSVKTVFLEISQNSHKSTCARVSFLNKVAGGAACNFIKKRDSDTGAFLWILRNFWEQLFYRTPPGDCFYLCPRLCVVLIFFSFFLLVISFIVCHVRLSLCNMSFSENRKARFPNFFRGCRNGTLAWNGSIDFKRELMTANWNAIYYSQDTVWKYEPFRPIWNGRKACCTK